jgi:hypothetical protein
VQRRSLQPVKIQKSHCALIIAVLRADAIPSRGNTIMANSPLAVARAVG